MALMAALRSCVGAAAHQAAPLKSWFGIVRTEGAAGTLLFLASQFDQFGKLMISSVDFGHTLFLDKPDFQTQMISSDTPLFRIAEHVLCDRAAEGAQTQTGRRRPWFRVEGIETAFWRFFSRRPCFLLWMLLPGNLVTGQRPMPHLPTWAPTVGCASGFLCYFSSCYTSLQICCITGMRSVGCTGSTSLDGQLHAKLCRNAFTSCLPFGVLSSWRMVWRLRPFLSWWKSTWPWSAWSCPHACSQQDSIGPSRNTCHHPMSVRPCMEVMWL